MRNCLFGPKLLGTVCLDAWCKSRYTVTIRKQMCLNPKNGWCGLWLFPWFVVPIKVPQWFFVVVGFAGKVEDLSASCANTLPPWLSLFARWTPGWFLFGGWGGKRIGILKFQRLKWDYQCLGYVYCKWELNRIPGKSRNNELFLVLFFNHQGRPWINMNQKLRVIIEIIWWHEEPKFEMVSCESSISERHISILYIYTYDVCVPACIKETCRVGN